MFYTGKRLRICKLPHVCTFHLTHFLHCSGFTWRMILHPCGGRSLVVTDEMIIHFSHAPSTYLFHPVPKILQNLEVLVLLLGVKAKKSFNKKTTDHFFSVFASGIFVQLVEMAARHFMSEYLGFQPNVSWVMLGCISSWAQTG